MTSIFHSVRRLHWSLWRPYFSLVGAWIDHYDVYISACSTPALTDTTSTRWKPLATHIWWSAGFRSATDTSTRRKSRSFPWIYWRLSATSPFRIYPWKSSNCGLAWIQVGSHFVVTKYRISIHYMFVGWEIHGREFVHHEEPTIMAKLLKYWTKTKRFNQIHLSHNLWLFFRITLSYIP